MFASMDLPCASRSCLPASVSHRCQAPVMQVKQQRCSNRLPIARTAHRPARNLQLARAASEEKVKEGPTFMELWSREEYMGDNSYAINNKYNTEPDFDDPEWYTKVDDWHEFWNYQRWDREIEGLEDDVDVAGTPVNTTERALRLMAAIKDVELRAEVQQWMPPREVQDREDLFEYPPVTPVAEDLNPDLSYSDVRAVAEKRRWRELMDLEWRRRQSLVNRFQHVSQENDVRLQRFKWEELDREMTQQEVYDFITANGVNAKPEDHEAFVENPLVPIDYVTTMGVQHIEDTEDFLERIGHLATPEDIEQFDREIVLRAAEDADLDEHDLELLADDAMAMQEQSLAKMEQEAKELRQQLREYALAIEGEMDDEDDDDDDEQDDEAPEADDRTIEEAWDGNDDAGADMERSM
mmetsp:Transcript_37519/g.83510  ORF Transcript_37519/g.83510 Transcript_37519/m.83510 type:complete len:410 (+) Transcript_37519:32-1261(+)